MFTGLLRPNKIRIPGSDIAGTVKAVGKNVERFKPGDKVFGDLTGSWSGFAEFVCAKENQLLCIPDSMSFIDAAAIPQAAPLTVQELIDRGKLKEGQKVLINGAGGGVGTFVAQIAKQFGAHVTGVDSSEKQDFLRNNGFNQVIDYEREDFTGKSNQYDLILDAKTNRPVSSYLRVLNRGGAYVSVGGESIRIMQVLFAGFWTSLFHKKHLRIVGLKPNKDLENICEMYNSGKVRPVIDGPFPFGEIVEALKRFEESKH